jgi:localization factor PodJL
MKRVKSLFIAASVIAIVVGSIQIAGNVLDFGNSKTAKTARAPDADTAMTGTVVPGAKPEHAANPLEPLKQPAGALFMPPTGGIAAATAPPLDLNQTAQDLPSLLNPPMLGPKGDVTGSISRPAGNNPAPRQPAPSTQPSPLHPDRLPIAIGGVYLRSAATAGDAAAAYEVGVRFAEGRGVPVNLEEAAHWFERASAKDLAPAQFRYASLLEKGQGVKKDLARARQIYLAAAAKGNAKAMHNLAVLYAEGIDGKPEYATAAQWFHKAANGGISDSQYNLGVLAARGLGVEKSMAESYKWFALAAAQGDREAAKKRDDVAAHLDPNALTAAKQAVKTFVAKPQPEEAVSVPAPAGGWDHAASAPPPKAQPRPAGPLALGAFNAGKR